MTKIEQDKEKIDSIITRANNMNVEWANEVLGEIVPYLENPYSQKVSWDNGHSGKRIFSALDLFFYYSTVSQLKKQETVFRKNVDNPRFKALLFTVADLENASISAYINFSINKKLELLLQWGFDPNTRYENSFNRLEYGRPVIQKHTNPTLLHLVSKTKLCDLLLSHGASTTATCQLYENYATIKKLGIKELPQSLDKMSKKEYLELYSVIKPIEPTFPVYESYRAFNADQKRMFFKTQNEYFASSGIDYTPYDLAVKERLRAKYLQLRPYENSHNIEVAQKSEMETVLNFMRKNPKKLSSAKTLLNMVLQEKNSYILNHLEQFKSLITPEFMFRVITENNADWLEAIMKTGYIDKDAKNSTGLGFMEYAAKKGKVQMFKALDNAGYNQDISKTFDYLNSELNSRHRGTTGLDTAGLCTGILYILANKGYRFDNQKLLKYAIDLEKNALEAQLNKTSSNPVENKKAFKL